MNCRFKYIVLYCIVLFRCFASIAQVAVMPDSVCIGAAKHYNVDLNSVPGSTYTWRIDGIPQPNYTTNEIDIIWNTIGSFVVDVQEQSLGGCIGPLISGRVFVNPIPTIVTNSNSTICEGSSIYLIAQSVIGVHYFWTGPNGYSSSDQNPIIYSSSITDAGIYSLIGSIYNCSSSSSSVSIAINNCDEDNFNIPEGFSPNGDGINDFFVIRAINRYPNNSIVIFNRWGNKVFEAKPYQNTWNGKTTKGFHLGEDELPSGTYFYIFDFGDGSFVFKGTIYLTR